MIKAKLLATVAAATVTVLGVAACAVPTTSVEPAPTVTVTEDAPAPVGNTDSKRDRFAAVASEVLGMKIYEDDPVLDSLIESVEGICSTLEAGRDSGIPADVALELFVDAAEGDETLLILATGGITIYCPVEADWLMSGYQPEAVS